MKKPILTTLLIFVMTWSYAQQTSLTTNPKISSRDHLVLKSKNFSDAGWTCMVGGTALTVISLAVFTHDNTIISPILIVMGISSMFTSIPLLVQSLRLNHKAKLMLANEKTASGIPGLSNKTITGLAIRIPLGKFSLSH
ncbi:MAG: hypothetical protein ABI402_03315 [Ferruginibacter sp.]